MKNHFLIFITSLLLIGCHKKPSGTKSEFISTDELKTSEKHEFFTDIENNGTFTLYDSEMGDILLSGKICNLSPTQSGLQFNVASDNGLAMVKVHNKYTDVVINSSNHFFIFDSYEDAKNEYGDK